MKSDAQVALDCGVELRSVQRIKSKLRSGSGLEEAPRSGRPQTVRTSGSMEAVAKSIKDNPSQSIRGLAEGFGCAESTLRNLAHRDLGMKYSTRRQHHPEEAETWRGGAFLAERNVVSPIPQPQFAGLHLNLSLPRQLQRERQHRARRPISGRWSQAAPPPCRRSGVGESYAAMTRLLQKLHLADVGGLQFAADLKRANIICRSSALCRLVSVSFCYCMHVC